MNVRIIGIGAIGSFVTSQLSKTSDLYFFNRSEKHTIQVKLLEGIFYKKVNLTDLEYNKINFDWLIICVKEYQTSSVLKSIVLILQRMMQL